MLDTFVGSMLIDHANQLSLRVVGLHIERRLIAQVMEGPGDEHNNYP